MDKNVMFAYAAGLLDGDGCFSIQKSGGTYRTTIQIQMTSRQPVRWLYEQFGGHFGSRPATGNTEALYIWVLGAKPKIAAVIPQLLVYLQTKQLPAMILLEFCQRFNVTRTGRYTPEEYADMDRYHKLIMLANSKGPGSNEIKDNLMKIVGGTDA